MRIDREAVIWGYRLFLDREPESEAVIIEKVQELTTTSVLRQAFFSCEEFAGRNRVIRAAALSCNEPRMPIEEVRSWDELKRLFDHVQSTWNYLGKSEPFWSVITADRYRQANLTRSAAKDGFYNSGRNDITRLLSTLARNGIPPGALKSCLEFGCGVGRTTGWLAEQFTTVHAYDISEEHLKIAQTHLRERNIHNTSLKLLKTFAELESLPAVDLVFSILVLQHNPPPIIAAIIRHLLRALTPGGIAIFQVPTYRKGYRFSLKDYLAKQNGKRNMEMHVLPQATIFELVAQEHGIPLEVLEDGYTGMRTGELSNTFVVKKGNATEGRPTEKEFCAQAAIAG